MREALIHEEAQSLIIFSPLQNRCEKDDIQHKFNFVWHHNEIFS